MIHKKISLILILLFLLLAADFLLPPASAADIINPVFDHLNRNDGLSNLSVSSIIEDRYGFLWFGTQSGLNYYNGREFVSYRNNPHSSDGLIHNLIQTMYYDSKKHQLWIGTYQGVSRLDIASNTFKNYSVADGLSNSIVIAIIKDVNGDLLFGTMNGLNRLNPETDKIEHYQIPGEVIRDLFVDSKQRLWIASYQGLLKYNRENNSIEKVELELPGEFVMAVKEYQEEILTLALWDEGIVKIDISNQNKIEVTKKFSFSDNRIYSLLKTNFPEADSPYNNLELVGSWGGGLYIIDEQDNVQEIKSKAEGNTLSHPIVYSLFQDRSGIIWLGTNGGGLNKINPQKENLVLLNHNPKNKTSLSQGKINSIYVDHNNHIWIAVYGSGIERYIPEENRIVKYSKNAEGKNHFPHNSVTDILNRNNKELYLATDFGIVSYNYENQRFKEVEILNDDYLVYSLAESDDRIWIGTYNNGLFSYNKNSKKIRQYKNGEITDNLIYDTLIDSQNRLWAATNNGLNLINLENNKIKKFYKEANNYNQPASNTFRELYEDSNQRIWAATVGGGISYYNEDGTFTTFLEEDGLASNIITGIAEDRYSKIWLASHGGISIIDQNSGSVFNLTPADGIGGWEFNTAYSAGSESDLLFGGNHGITSLSDDFTQKNIESPPVYITDFQLFQQSVDKSRQHFNGEYYEFDADENYLAFEFAALDYDSPQNIKYTYKLEGFDQNWINAGDRYFSSYSNLNAGDYRFKVRAETIRGKLSQEAFLDFKINKPWFLTLPAFILYLLILILIVVLIIRLRDSIIIDQKNKELKILNNKFSDANKELKELSNIDSLTQIYNRHYFNNKFKELFAISRRSKTPISLIIFDLDKFKKINDNYGHLVGDQVLKTSALRTKNTLNRDTDFIARFGGDEFVIVLFDTDQEGALQVINEVKKNIENPIEVTINGDKTNLNIKASFGLKTLIPALEDNYNQIINAADQNLYKNKRNK